MKSDAARHRINRKERATQRPLHNWLDHTLLATDAPQPRPSTIDIQKYEQSVAAAVTALWEASGRSADPLPTIPFEELRQEMLRNCASLLREYEETMNPFMAMNACASCGEWTFGNSNVVSLADKQLQLLAARDADLVVWRALPAEWQCALNVVSIPEQPRELYLHADYIDWAKRAAALCDTCHGSLYGQDPKLPPFSIANGFNFGQLPKCESLPPLTLVEQKLLSFGYKTCNVIKLVVSSLGSVSVKGFKLKGHMVIFPRDGPAAIAPALFDKSRPALRDQMFVMFVGTQAQWEKLRNQRLQDGTPVLYKLLHKYIAVRPHVLRQYLDFYSRVNCHYSQFAGLAAAWTDTELEAIPHAILNSVGLITDAKTVWLDNMVNAGSANAWKNPLGEEDGDTRPHVAPPSPPATDGHGSGADVAAHPPPPDSDVNVDVPHNVAPQPPPHTACDAAEWYSDTDVEYERPLDAVDAPVKDITAAVLLGAAAPSSTGDEEHTSDTPPPDSDGGAPADPNTLLSNFTMDFCVAMGAPVAGNPGAWVLHSFAQLLRSGDPQLVHVTTSAQPFNEFDCNGRALTLTFPELFVLGRGCPYTSVPRAKYLRHLMILADRRFATHPDFVFLLYNQLQRHEACRVVAAHLDTNDKGIDAFLALANDPSLPAKLAQATKDPTCPAAQDLLRTVTPLIRVTSSRVQYSVQAREAVLSRIKAMNNFFGLPSWFITIAPADINSLMILRLTGTPDPVGADMHAVAASFRVPTFAQRAHAVSHDPAAAAEYYGRLVRCVFSILLRARLEGDTRRLPPAISDPEREQGLYGVSLGFAGVTEEQQRLSLHLHFVLYTYGLNPMLLQQALSDPALIANIQARLDLMVQAYIPEDAEALHLPAPVDAAAPCVTASGAEARQLQRVHPDPPDTTADTAQPAPAYPALPAPAALPVDPAPPPELDRQQLQRLAQRAGIEHRRNLLRSFGDDHSYLKEQTPPPDPGHEHAFLQCVYRDVVLCNLHEHSFTCHKGTVGKTKCRLGFAAPMCAATRPVRIVCPVSEGHPPAVYQSLYATPGGPRTSNDKWPLPDTVKEVTTWELYRPPPGVPEEQRVAVFNQYLANSLVCADGNAVQDDPPPGLNSYVVPFTPTLTAAVRSNTSVQPMGNDTAARVATFYVADYMMKDKQAPGQLLALMAHGYGHCQDRVSVATDSGEPMRNAKYFLQSMLMQMLRAHEVGMTTATARLLGHPNEWYSHKFWFLFPKPAVEYMKKKSVELFGAAAHDDSVVDATHAGSDSESQDGCDVSSLSDTDTDLDAALDDVEEDPTVDLHAEWDCSRGQTRHGGTYVKMGDTGAVLTQWDDYVAAVRGGLHGMCFYEFVSLVHIERKDSDTSKKKRDPAPDAANGANAAGDNEGGVCASDVHGVSAPVGDSVCGVQGNAVCGVELDGACADVGDREPEEGKWGTNADCGDTDDDGEKGLTTDTADPSTSSRRGGGSGRTPNKRFFFPSDYP
ncbi:DUF6570 domain-containing protein, partial [Silvimonas sp.]|uniref:DUF6570 domain-containing protein n=1 Tax=Silvimonas sp. TaxID=2650811 RepID=UPI00283CDD79